MLKSIFKIIIIFILTSSWFLSGWPWPKIKEAKAAITYQSAGAFAYSAASGTSVAPAYPASVASGNLLVLIIGMKPTTANGGTVTTPSGWTLITSLTGAGGYGATLGADTGNTNIFAYYKVAAGGESGSLTVTIGNNNVSWGQIHRLTNATGAWSVAGATGSDTSAGNVSIAFSSNPGVTSGDYILGAMVIPTDVTTPAQFSAEALSQTGATFGAVTEVEESDSGNGNDIGGFVVRATVSSGTGSVSPTMTATAGGTTTNVRGPGIFIRMRESTPAVVSVTITSDGTVSYGTLAASGTKSTIELGDTQIVKNDGNLAEDFTIKTSVATGGTQWSLGSVPGVNTFVHEFSTNGGGGWTKFTTADSYQSFVSNIAANGTQNLDLRITLPTSSTDSQQKSITITILATQH